MFTGQENHDISLADAAKLTKKYRDTLMGFLGGIKGEYFGGEAIQSVLAQNDVVGIRIYYGLSADLIPLPQMVIVGVNAAGNDVTAGVVLEHGYTCPPKCGIANVLNT